MVQLTVKGASGNMDLLAQHETETGRLCRLLELQASDDGRR